MVVAKIGQYLGHAKLRQGGYGAGNMPEYGADAGHLAKYVDAKASAFLGNVGKIEVVAFVETVDLLLRENLAHVTVEFGVG